jgi:transposase-like protein
MSDPIVSFDESAIRNELKELVKKTVEDTINALLEEEADALVGAERYERTADREAYRAGHYDRKLTTTSGVVNIEMPKLKGVRFATAVIERYRRREVSVEEAIVEMYLAGVSTRRIEDVADALWGASVSAGTVSNLNEKAFKGIEEWRSRPLVCKYRYVYIDGIYLKRSWGGSFENVAVMVAIGVNDEGYREVIGCAEGFTESKECWAEFLSWLKSRGLCGVKMFTGDKDSGMVGALVEVFPDARYQRCTVHFYRNVLAKVPKSKRPQVAAMLKAIHAQESREASDEKAVAVADRLRAMKLGEAAKVVQDGITETLSYTAFPMEHWKKIRTNNAIERLNREIRRRTRVVGTFPDGHSALMLVTARLKYVADSEWGSRRYLDVSFILRNHRLCLWRTRGLPKGISCPMISVRDGWSRDRKDRRWNSQV